jgi:peptide/nickel transport system substrate-binding protein
MDIRDGAGAERERRPGALRSRAGLGLCEPISRRGFLQTAGLGAVAVGGMALVGCGSSPTSGHPATSTAVPRRGGTLNVGFTGGSSSDTLNPFSPVANVDYARVNNLFDLLVRMTPDGQPVLYLAEEVVPNADATIWTVRVRSGVRFHNGKELTADDVIYTFQQTFNPKAPGEAASALHALEVANMKKLDAYTVSLPFSQPIATLVQVLSTNIAPYIVPVGFDVTHPVGTGPFMYKTFSPGVESTFVRNPNYWLSGLPYADTLVITDYADETSQTNSLLSGQSNLIGGLSSLSISPLRSQGKEVLISEGGGWNPFTMRTDIAPFSDVRVRQALRLIVDRKQMMDVVFGGYGTIGNDIFGIFAPEYDHSIPQRQQDIDQAKSLLKAAGQENLSVQLVTSDIAQGVVQMATVFAQQASKAGVKVSLLNTNDFFGPNYLKWVFAQDYWDYNYYLPQVADATLPTAPFNECHFDNPRYTALYKEAVATVDQAKRTEISHEMQMIDYTEGGYIIPFFLPVIDAYEPGVQGVVAARSGLSFNNYDFKRMWLS